MTEPTYVTKDEVKELIAKALKEYHEELTKVLTEAKEAAEDKINTTLEGVVEYGDKVALQSDNGMFICAEEGGPTEEEVYFKLKSRNDVGPWESWTVTKGQ